ncbi:MAG: hydantoinase/carbamoylase family amidase [Pseudomonadota bacterium]
MVEIKAERLLADLYELRAMGAYKTGVHRPTLSDEDIRSRHWLASKLEAIGHRAEIDGIANVVGFAAGDGPHVLAGSHLESQDHAGWLDGALGVIYALEAARAVAESGQFGSRGVDVIAFADEEGHFGSFLGSYSWLGELSEDTIDRAVDRTRHEPLRDALARCGLGDRPRLRMPDGRYSAFLEAHIEQGDWLEANALTVGVVTSIVAIWQYRIVIEGTQNHAGTTRMAIRRDAGVAATRLLQTIEREFPAVAGARSVWTAGSITLEPGAPSIVPGTATVLFQLRDADPETLDRMQARLEDLVGEENQTGPCDARLEIRSRSVPAVMDQAVQAALTRAGERHAPGKHVLMPSGAGHDAQNLARHLPSGMLFVPSIGGISHHWSENTTDDDIVTGARVFTSAIADLLSR